MVRATHDTTPRRNEMRTKERVVNSQEMLGEICHIDILEFRPQGGNVACRDSVSIGRAWRSAEE